MNLEGEIVGLRGTGNGRMCEIHYNGCGCNVKVGERIRFRSFVVEMEGNEVFSIGAVKVSDGVESCLIGFLPRYQLNTQGDVIGKYGTITKLYAVSPRAAEREIDHRNVGVARYQVDV